MSVSTPQPAPHGPTDPSADGGRTVLDSEAISRALTRIAHEILERNRGGESLVLLGIPSRGVPLAERIATRISEVERVRRPGRVARRDDVPRRPPDAPGPHPAAHPDPARRDRRQDGGAGRRRALLRPHHPGRARRDERRRPPARRCSSRCWSTAATGSCRSGPTSSARTCPPRWPRRSRVRLEEHDGEDGVPLAAIRGDRDEAHLLERGRPEPRRRRAGPGTAEEMRSLADRPIKKLPALRGRTIVNLFFEDSTRTRISFEAAAKRLSADVINFSAKGSSLSKGESLKDTALTLEAMGADAVVVRHWASGAPHLLAHAGWSKSSVVNAGDGTHEHPTQALLDAFTMWRHLAPSNGRKPRRPPGRHRRRRAAQPGGALQRPAAADPRRRGDPGRAADAAAVRRRHVGCHHVVRPRRGAAQGRRGDDAPRAAGADERRVLPDGARVQPALRHGRTPDGDAPGPHDRDAPRPDDPRHGDHGRRRRLRALGDRRAGHQRCRRPDGRPVPVAGRVRTRHRGETSEHAT